MTNAKAEFAFSKARSDLLLADKFFFFGRLSLFLKPVQKSDIPTLATDGRRIFYNPDYFMSLPPDLQRTAIAHEVMHCSNRHFSRRGMRNPGKFNRACDFAINPILKDAGMRLHESWLYEPQLAGMSAEEIYNLLPDDPSDNSKGMGGNAQDEVLDGSETPDDPDATPVDMDALEAEWKVNTAQAAFEAERRGKLPGHLKRSVGEMFQNKVPWREQLRAFFTEHAKDDYSWMRPNKMFAHLGVLLPGMYSEAMGPVDIVIDTSGSIDADTLNEFAAEIRAIHGQLKPSRVRVIYADADVNHIDTFGPHDNLEFNAHGGGGTDFRPAIAYAEENDPPKVLVYLTDMMGAFPQHEPAFDVLWCATTKAVGPIGTTIHLED